MILSSHGLLITYIDKHYKMTRLTLSDIMAQSLAAPSPNADVEQVKFVQRLVDKLKYCKEVLVSIRTASATGSAIPEESDAMGSALVADENGNGHAHVPATMTASRTTKTNLRRKNENERLN